MQGKGSVSMYFCNTRWPNHCGFFIFFFWRRIWQLWLGVTHDSVPCGLSSIWSIIIPLLQFLYCTVLLVSRVSLPPQLQTTDGSLTTLLLSSAALICFIFPRSTTRRPLCVYSICIHSRLSHILKPQNSSPVSRSFPYRMNPLGFQERVIRSRFSEDPLTLKGEVYTDGQTTYTPLSAAAAVAFPLHSNTRLT